MTTTEREALQKQLDAEHEDNRKKCEQFRKFLNEDHPLSRPLADWEMRILGGFGGYQSQVGKGAA